MPDKKNESRMDPNTWNRIEQLFHEAMVQPVAEQCDFVQRQSKGDRRIASEVLSLMESHNNSDIEFLARSQSNPIAAAIDSRVNLLLEDAKRHSPRQIDSHDQENRSTWRGLTTGEQASDVRTNEIESGEVNRDAWHDLIVQRLAPKFEVADVLSSGGMGTVFRALDRKLDRPVAIKVISAARCDETAVRRFIRESKLAGQVSSDHVVTTYSVDDDSKMPTIVMELVEGPTLRQLIKQRGTLTPDLAAEIARQTALGLADAHAQQLIHRDIKPANLMLQDFQLSDDTEKQSVRVKIIDFGIARDLQSDEETRTNALAGTPSFMSPEQIFAPESIDHRCDVYAVGATLYQMLTGEPPYRGAPHMIIRKMETCSLVPPRRWDDRIPVALESICLKALAHEPERRYQSANALARDLQRFLNRKPTLAKPVSSLTRLRLWQRRNQSLALALSLLFVSLLGGTIVSSAMWNRSSLNEALAVERANTIENTTRKLADNNVQMRLAIDSFFMNLLANESERADLSSEFQFKLLTQMTEYYSSVLDHADNDPDLIVDVCDTVVNFVDSQLENGGAHSGQMRFVTGWVDQRLAMVKEDKLTPHSLNVSAHNRLLTAEAMSLTPGMGSDPEVLKQAVELSEKSLSISPTLRGQRIHLLSKGSLINHRVRVSELSKPEAQLELFEIATGMDRLAATHPEELSLQIDRARTQRWLGKTGDAQTEIECRKNAAMILEVALQSLDLNDGNKHKDETQDQVVDRKLESSLRRKLSVNQIWLGYASARNGNIDSAFQLYDEGQKQLTKLLAKHPSSNQIRMDLAETEVMIADLRWFNKQHSDSLTAYQRAIEWFDATLDSDPSQLIALRRICQVHHLVAMRKAEIDSTDQVNDHWRQAISGYRSLLARGSFYVGGQDLSFFDQLLSDAIEWYSTSGNEKQAEILRDEQNNFREENHLEASTIAK